MERPVLNTLLKGGTMLKTPMPGALSQPPFGGAIATIIRKDGPGATGCDGPGTRSEKPCCTGTTAIWLQGCEVWMQDPNVVLLMPLWLLLKVGGPL